MEVDDGIVVKAGDYEFMKNLIWGQGPTRHAKGGREKKIDVIFALF